MAEQRTKEPPDPPYRVVWFDGPGPGRKTAFKVYPGGFQARATAEESQMGWYIDALAARVAELEAEVATLTAQATGPAGKRKGG